MKRLIKKIAPRFLKRIYYGRIRSNTNISGTNTFFYNEKMEKSWKEDYGHFHDLRCETLMSYVEGSQLLDIGTGNGQIIRHIKSSQSVKLICSDISESSLINLANNYANCSFICLDVNNQCIKDSSVDSVIMGEVLEHLHDPKSVLINVSKILTADGKIIISVPTKYGLFGIIYDGLWAWLRGGYDQDGHVQRFRYKQLTSIIESAGYKIEKFENFCIFGFFLKYKWLINLDNKLSKFVPHIFANNWIIIASKI